MPIPQSSLFPLADWNARASYTSTEPNDRSIVDPVDGISAYLAKKDPGFLVDTDTDQVFMVSDASKLAGVSVLRTEARLDIQVPESFTFEFDITLTEDLPKHFGLVNNRIYVGASNDKGAVVGLLFSYQGLALCSGYDDIYPTVLGGSEKYLFDENGLPVSGLTVRVTVDAAMKATTIYLAPTSDAYNSKTGGALWALQPDLSPISTVTTRVTRVPLSGVQFIATAMSQEKLLELDLEASAGQSAVFGISSVRISGIVLVPVPRPVAVATATLQAMLGTPINLNGGGSYDPASLGSLTFDWELESVPDGSAATLTGSQQATLAIGDVLKILHKKPTSAANSYKVVIAAHVNQGLHTTAVYKGGVLTITLAVIPGVNGQLVPKVAVKDLIDLFNNPLNPGYLKETSSKFGVSATGDQLALVPTGTYLFENASPLGAGSNSINPVLNADVPGFYTVSLVVSNGTRPSLKTRVTTLVCVTDQLLRHRPNTDYIFHHLPDFWNLIPDKEQMTTIWSAMSQVISADILETWQADHYKAHRDVSRLYQRRWLPYSTEVVPDQKPTLVIPPLTASFSPLNTAFTYQTLTPLVTESGVLATKKAGLTGFKVMKAPLKPGDKVLYRDSVGKPKIAVVAGVENVVNKKDEWEVTFAANDVSVYTVLTDNSAGYFVGDTSKVAQNYFTSWFTNPSYSLNQANTVLDKVRIFETNKKVTDYPITQVNPLGAQGVPSANVLKLAVPVERAVDNVPYRWQHLRSVYGHYMSVVPYVQFPSATDLSTYDLELGDYVDFKLTDPATGMEFISSVTILAVDKTSIFVQWDPLFQQLSAMTQVPVGAGKKIWKFSELGKWLPKFKAIRRSRRIPGYDDLLSVPLLGTPLEPKFNEGTDHYTKDHNILMKDWVLGEVVTKAGTNVVTFTGNSIFHTDFKENTLPLEDLISLGATTLILESGDAGSYQITKTDQAGTYTLDRAVLVSGNYVARMPRFHHNRPSNDVLWGEVSYFDNYKVIESNFGLYVGLPKSQLDTFAKGADYLSVVRSMWFAFLSGPSLKNLSLPIQALSSIPYAEESGQVIDIVPPGPTTPGYVTIVGKTTDAKYVYKFPEGLDQVDIAVNPSTGRTIKAYTSLKPPANKAQQDLYDDSIIQAFTPLFSVVLVEDYVSNPRLADQVFRGQDILRKYHTFVVTIPLNFSKSTQVFPLIKQFLNDAKPAHTNYILLGSFALDDDVAVTDEIGSVPTLFLKDGLGFAPFNALKVQDPEFDDFAIVPLEKENKLWPVEGAAAAFINYPNKLNIIPVWAAQAYAAGAEVIHLNRNWRATAATQAADVPGTSTLWIKSLWVGDTKERYESGYVEGVLDNYSGDGSNNSRNGALDMVNRLDHGDIDVCRSKMWIPIQKIFDGKNFQIGEKLELLGLDAAPISTVWSISPPVVEYVGAGVDPKLPGVTFSQEDHQYTYLWVGFEYMSDQSYDCLGTEARLDGLVVAAAAVQGAANVVVRGVTSAATAILLAAPDRTDPQYKNYFYLDKIFRNDKFDDYGPEDRLNVTMTQYLSETGKSITAFQTASSSFNNLEYYRAVQTVPYRDVNVVPANQQFVPSIGPGAYTHWNVANPAVTKVNWGYVGNQNVSAVPTAITAFARTANPDLKNLHYGMTLASKKGLQYSQGFTSFEVPYPSIRRVRKPVPVNEALLRIEGHFFVGPELVGNPPAPVIPATPTTYAGVTGGCWVFFRPTGHPDPYDYNVWREANSVTFVTGLQVGETVLWKDAAVQDRTGHVLEVILPTLPDLPAGTYDVIIRQYRPYLGPINQPLLHYDEAVAIGAISLANNFVLTAVYAVPEYWDQTAQQP